MVGEKFFNVRQFYFESGKIENFKEKSGYFEKIIYNTAELTPLKAVGCQ